MEQLMKIFNPVIPYCRKHKNRGSVKNLCSCSKKNFKEKHPWSELHRGVSFHDSNASFSLIFF